MLKNQSENNRIPRQKTYLPIPVFRIDNGGDRRRNRRRRNNRRNRNDENGSENDEWETVGTSSSSDNDDGDNEDGENEDGDSDAQSGSDDENNDNDSWSSESDIMDVEFELLWLIFKIPTFLSVNFCFDILDPGDETRDTGYLLSYLFRTNLISVREEKGMSIAIWPVRNERPAFVFN